MCGFLGLMAVPLVLSFVVIFAPFMGKDEDMEEVDVDYMIVDINKLCKLLQKDEAERRAEQYKTRLKYSLVGYRES